ncbi:MAG: hypothetical protein JXB50_11445 [Spirochaetes bacterium]|nr:hypothetical protein [Spirochaetota bacterium]
MKHLIFILFITGLIFSCTAPEGDNFVFDLPSFNNIKDCRNWVLDYLHYRNEADGTDQWQLPQETLDKRRGDCEDYSILIMAIWYYQHGDKLDLIILNNEDGECHAVVDYHGTFIQSTGTGRVKYREVIGRVNYDTAIWKAKYD